MENQNCHCCSGKPFVDCCAPILQDASKALSAEQLMRSRFSAHKLVDVAYLTHTLHASKRTKDDATETTEWAKENHWQKLEIVSTELGSETDARGKVEFKAYFEDKNKKIHCHHENSNFVKLDNQWYYVDGLYYPSTKPKTQHRNDVCACGSGKKYKKCCGF